MCSVVYIFFLSLPVLFYFALCFGWCALGRFCSFCGMGFAGLYTGARI